MARLPRYRLRMADETKRRFWVMFPGASQAEFPWYGDSEDDIRAQIRRSLGKTRLPAGIQIWEQEGPTWYEQERERHGRIVSGDVAYDVLMNTSR